MQDLMVGNCTQCGWMMAGGVVFSVLGVAVLVLGIAALIKYLRSGPK